ncbi:MAG: Cna B-type domain-containing protein [Lachnospiraceae bacterium]|nr:Cna B-type domain-containing protein [Lachnospiraceae bacterium]
MKKVTKSFVAILALIAMLTQNAFGVYAQATAPEPIQVENEYVSENAEPTVEVTTEETPVDTSESNEGDLTEPVDATLDVENLPPTDDVNYDDQIMLIDDTAEVADEGTDVAAEESVTEEVIEEEIPEQLDIYDNQISGSGLNELEIFINTEQLVTGDSFRILFSGPDSAQYDTRLNDYLDTTSHGLYRFLDLNNEGFNIRATSDDNVTFEFASEDGRPVIKVISVESDDDKLLFTKTIEDKDGKPVTAIKGEGLKDVSITVNSEKLTDNAKYTVYVDTEAEVVMNGSTTDSISGTKSLESIELSNLNKKQFIIYISGDEEFEIDSDASVIDVVEGQAEFILESVATKTVYEYEDSNVYVRAVLERADAIPDDAYFSVEPITDTKEYLDAMNEGEEKYTDENTLLYDIAFYTDSTKTEEIEPEAGSVSVTIRFKKNQINDDLSGEAEVEDVTVTHFEENGNTIEAVPVETSVSSDNTKVDFTVDSFSVYAVSATSTVTVNPGTSVTCDSVLGDAYYYGIVGNYVNLAGHLESNMAVGTLNGNTNIATPKNEGGGAGVTYIGSYLGSKFFMDPNSDTKGTIKVYTTEDAVNKFGSEMADRINSGKVSIDYSKSESEIKSIVSNMVDVVASNSSKLANESTQVDYTELKKIKGTDGFIDISDSEAGTYYINYDNSEWANEGSSFKFKINSSQNLVLNIPDESVNFNQYQLYIDGKQYTPQGNSNEEILFEKVIYNCPNATYAATTTPVTGTFLLPKAGFENNSVAAGFVVADRIEKIGGQEWHCISKNIPVIEDDKTELEIPVTKYFKDAQGNDIADSEWPANGFKFKISKYPCDDPGDTNDGYVEKDINYIPDIEGTKEVTIYGSTPNHTASFGKLSFNGAEVYNSDRSHKSYSFGDRDVKYRALMYKIEEIDTNEPGVVYDNATPLYIKVFVNAEKINLGNGTTKYLVWTEVKTARTVLKYECLPKLPEFTNRRVDDTNIKFEGTKTVNGSSENVPNEKFEFSLYKYKGNNQFEETPVQAVMNNNNSFAFKEFKVNYNECTTYVDANGKAIKDGDRATKIKNSVYAYQYYLIKETKCDSPYTANDKYIARVKIEKLFNNGALSGYGASVEYFKYGVNETTDIGSLSDGLMTMAFDNEYKANGSISFYAKKVVSNRTYGVKNEEFSFSLFDENGTKLQTVKNDSNGLVSFSAINYSLNDAGKEFKYVIKEDSGEIPGITYDTHEETITVKVSDKGDGTLQITADKATETSPATFTNVYKAEGTFTFTALKAFKEGSKLPSGKSFSFVLKEDGKVIETISVNGTGSVSFKPLKYAVNPANGEYAVGEHTYSIEEVKPAGATAENNYTYQGITYDNNVYTVKLVVEDDGNGNLVTKVDGNVQATFNATFTNDYKVADTKIALDGNKILNGQVLEGDMFTFKLEASDEVTSKAVSDGVVVLPANTAVKNDANGNFSFGEILFKAEGNYTFKVTEEKPDETNGIQYSEDVYTVSVSVKDDNNGKLVATKTITKNNGEVGDIKFVNYYAENGIVISAKKSLEGRTLEANQFEFELKDDAGNVIRTAKNDAAGNVTFEKITYKLSDLNGEDSKTYKYYVNEVCPDKDGNGYTYDRTVKTVTVTVSKVESEDGVSLQTVAEFENGDDIFKNYYEASGQLVFGGTKELIGRKFTSDDNGKFQAVLKDKTTGEELQRKDITKKATLFSDRGGEFTFDPIKFTEPGEYYYTVEEAGSLENVTNDTTVYEVKVTVTDNGDGTLSCVPTYSVGEGIKFTNVYDTPGSATIQAYKSLDYGTLKDDQFTFELYDSTGAVLDTATNNSSGTVTFKQLEYSLKDLNKDTNGNAVTTEFRYKIKEKNTGAKGYEYSAAEYDVIVTVVPSDDTLTTSVEYKDAEGNAVDSKNVIFKNEYTAIGEVQLQAKKVLSGRDITNGMFEFELRDENNEFVAKVPVPAAKAGEDAIVSFPKWTFTQENLKEDSFTHAIEGGKFAKYYTIREVIPANIPSGYTYDDTVYNVVVTLMDNGEGVIETDWYAYESGNTYEKPTIWDNIVAFFTGKNANQNVAFVNEYVAEGQVQFSAHKSVTGAALAEGEFEFNLSGMAEDGSKVNQTLKNDADGNVTFSAITYTKPGEYTYTIKEVIPSKENKKPGYTYDETEYKATVTVTDNGSGVLKVNTKILGGESSITAESDVAKKPNGDEYGLCVPDAVQFVNDYKADDVSITVGGTKTLTGKKLVVDEFSFTMVNADSNTKVYEETVKNAADGSFSFPTITYTFADMKNADGTYAVNKTFAYVVTEGTGTEEGVEYSTQNYNVVVEVTNANGKLSTKLLVNDLDKSKTPLQAVNFLNTYNVNGQTSLKVVKVVTGKEKSDKVDDKFTFELYDSSDNLIAERTIKADEEGVFDNLDELKYDLNRLDKQSDGSYKKTFTYKMKEKTGDNAGFTYSNVIYNIQVEVVSSPEGVMTITKNITDKDGKSAAEPMAFENSYKAVGNVTIEGTKTLVSKNKLSKGDFQFVIKEGETEVSRVHNGYFMDLVDATSVEITNDSLSADDFALKLYYDQSQIGEHVYTISEVIPESKNAKMVYDGHIATVKVVVTDNGDGTLNCVKTVGDGTANANPSFVNYEVEDDAVQFTAVKSMSGMALADDMFTFTLEDEKGNELQSVTNKGTAVVFDKITYTLADVGKHTYKIRETRGTNKGITYSTEVYTAVVTVTYDDGRLKVSKEIKNSEGTVVNSSDSDGMVFENKYESKTKVQFSGEKFLVGFDKKDEAYKGKYSFELIDSTGTVIDSAEVTGAGKFDFGVIEYTQDHYNSIPDHKIYYTVKEKAVDEQSHITYDTTVYHIAVELGYNDDGTLKATVSTTEGVDATHNGLVFTNYTAEGTVPFVGTKTVKGANLKSGDYSFELYKGDTLLETVENKGASFVFTPISYTQKEVGSHTYFIKEKTGSVMGMEYDSTVYKIVVTVADNGDGTLDVTKKTYKNDVEVSSELTYAVPFVNEYEAKGETSLEGIKILENRAIKDSDYFTFKLKDSEGNPIDSVECGKDGKFTFDGDYFKYDQEVLKNAAGSYDESVTKYFTVEEVKGDVAGVEYSDDVYAVAVTITDKHNGELEVKNSVKLTNESDKTGFVGLIDSIKNSIAGSNDTLEFTNTYKAQGEWDPEGWKELVGRDLKDGEFEFKIREVDLKNNTVNGHEYVVKNVGNQIKFSSDDVVSKKGDYFLKYTQDDLGPDGTANFIYEFSEVKQETATGIKFDEDIYKILVEVSDNGDGTLNVKVDRDDLLKKLTQKIKDSNLEDKNISENAIFLFTNEYEAYGSLNLIGTKTFDGPEEFLKDFKFTIKETTEGKESPEFTVPCENGVITFSNSLSILSYEYKPTMKLDDRGTHTYEIREVIPADDSKAPGVKYDERVYKVTVDVADDGEGKLVPTVKSITRELNGDGQEPYEFFVGNDQNPANYFTFENKYEANADLLFKGMKFLKRYEDSKDYITGDELKNFEFALYRVDATKDTLIDYATASADGSFVLGLDDNGDIAEGLKFTQKDIGKTYTYKLYEEKRVGDGVLYDENVYEITVAVNAPAAGSDKLKLDVTAIDKSGATVAVKLENDEYLYTASTFDFTNLKPEYTVISGEKHWVGGPADGSRPDEVTIKLYASNVGVGQQVINTAVAKAPDWKYRFDSFENGKKLPAYTTDGQKIVYRVDEVEIPGYLSEKVEVVEGKVYDFYNTYGELLIRKVDAITGATLAGAELVILDSAGTEVDRWVSGTSAHAVDITKVEFDKTYTLREVSAPTGYKVAPDQTFTFKKGETTVVTMRDEKITGSVKLRKLDATTRAALEGAEFALYREDGSRVYASGTAGSYRYSETSSNGRFVVNAAGELEVTDLPYGSYYFTETVAPAGYIRSTDRFSFSVLTDGETVEVVALNAKEVGSVRLRKTNADGSVSLAGAVFELYAKTPTTVSSAIAATIYSDVYYRVGTYTTDASGEIYVGDLPWDDYYFVEVEAPAGYEVNTDVNGDPIAYTFTIGSTATATVSYDLGRITNSTTPPDTPVVPSSGGEVRGERRPTDTGRRSGGVLSGVLGVRAAPKAGVLGERLGPVTGDAFNIFLWTLLLLASIGSIIAVAIANARRKKNAR